MGREDALAGSFPQGYAAYVRVIGELRERGRRSQGE